MENGKSVANWWQNTGIDMIYYLRRKLDEFRVNLDLQEFRMWYAMYGIFVYKSKKATELVSGSTLTEETYLTYA